MVYWTGAWDRYLMGVNGCDHSACPLVTNALNTFRYEQYVPWYALRVSQRNLQSKSKLISLAMVG